MLSQDFTWQLISIQVYNRGQDTMSKIIIYRINGLRFQLGFYFTIGNLGQLLCVAYNDNIPAAGKGPVHP